MTGRLWLLGQMALRNLFASRINLLIGGLILVGTVLFVVVGALLDSLNTSMARSVVGSLAGHIQIYSSRSKDEVSLYGNMGGDPDLAAVTEFPRIEEALLKLPDVKTVVPMGLSGALVTPGNVVDRTLARLRDLYRAREGQALDPALRALPAEEVTRRIGVERSHIRQIIKVLQGDSEKTRQDLLSDNAVDEEVVQALRRVSSDEFWDRFEEDAYANLEFLENKVAPVVNDANFLFLRYLGTDLDTFQKSFDRMTIVKGGVVPPGQRGFLLADYYHEEGTKLKNARRLDKLKEAAALGRRMEGDDELQRFARENRHQTREMELQLDGDKTTRAIAELTALLSRPADLLQAAVDADDTTFAAQHQRYEQHLKPLLLARRDDAQAQAIVGRFEELRAAREAGRRFQAETALLNKVYQNKRDARQLADRLKPEEHAALLGALGPVLLPPSLPALLFQFFDTTEDTVVERHGFFYEKLAPGLELYRIRVGDVLTIKAFSRSGYMQGVNVKVYGTFAFTGLEKSPLAGNTNLMDIVSFRDLYGYLTQDRAEEIKEIQRATGAKEVSRENAEAELFGGEDATTNVVAEATPGIIDADKQLSGTAKKLREEDLIRRVYSREEMREGVVLNGAVILKDPSRIDQAIVAINELSARENLQIKAVSWQRASGFLGQLINVFRVILFLAVGFVFFIAMVVINNAMMMATLQRTQMIGTMRAIGAQKSVVLSMVLLEALMLGAVFGGAGLLLGSGIVTVLNLVGIAAWNDILYFFFSGPRLSPELSWTTLALALALILVVTLVSTLFPALLATRVSPLRAMQTDD